MSNVFVELIIEGPELYLRGLLDGYIAAGQIRTEVIYGEDGGFADEGPLQKVKEALHLSGELTHVIVEASIAQLVRDAVRIGTNPKLTIKTDREIEKAAFEYSFAIYNREQGMLVLKAFRDLPDSVRLIGHKQNLELEPNASKPDIYSPVHQFELIGKGRLEGRVDKIVWIYKELGSFEQVDVHPIRILYSNP